MSAENVSIKECGPYQPREERWGIYYLRKAGQSYDDIANIVEMPKSTVQSTVDRIKKTGSPLPNQAKMQNS